MPPVTCGIHVLTQIMATYQIKQNRVTSGNTPNLNSIMKQVSSARKAE